MNRSYIFALCLLPTASLCMMDRFKLRSEPKPPRFKMKMNQPDPCKSLIDEIALLC